MVTEVNTEEMYKIIKKQNGEQFARVLRQNVLLDIPNLKHILEFAGTEPTDARNLVHFLREIREKSGKTNKTKQEEEIKDPIELLSEAGYDAFIVNNERQKDSIKKYYRPGEELCTFNDPYRHKKFYIIHAVKRGADKIKPSRHPEREDEYGTSVISIQIAKTGGFISIKNRYNHTVNNPDATFCNNPDDIIDGLTAALKHKFGVDFMTLQGAVLPPNYRLVNDQVIRFNYEIHNVYYGDKYYFKGPEITKLNTDYEVMLDTVILDVKTGKARRICAPIDDPGLVDVLNNEIYGHKIKIEKNKTTDETIINIIDENKNIKELARTKNGCITSLRLYNLSEIGYDFLRYNTTLEEFYAPKLKRIGDRVFGNGYEDRFAKINLRKLYLPELELAGEWCFGNLISLSELYTPKLKRVDCDCFYNMANIRKLYMPELEIVGNRSFQRLPDMVELYIPKLKEIGYDCFRGKLDSSNIERFFAPELDYIPKDCFYHIKTIRNLYAPKLKITEDTPKCIVRAMKLAKLKDGIRKILGLPQQHNFNKNNIVESQQVRK